MTAGRERKVQGESSTLSFEQVIVGYGPTHIEGPRHIIKQGI